MLTAGSMAFILVGVAFLAISMVMASRKRKKKSAMERVTEMFADYDKQMDRFRD